jgi:NhaP-type Na+/H+ or K+/H+ antiporter
MDFYSVIITLMGLAFLGAAWLPRLVNDAPLSFPFLYVLTGILLFQLPLGFYLPNPLESGLFTERFTELIVIVSLTGAGLKLDRPLSWHGWGLTWRLLLFAMPLCIAAVALLGWWTLGLAPASAVLLGAVLAPTDPVLASDVQVGAPHEEKEGSVRFALTSEAGLNDGLAFPFTYLAVAMAAASATAGPWLRDWFLTDVLYRLAVGTVSGVVIGYLLAYLFFKVAAEHTRSARDGFVVLAITFLSYGVTELLHGYGFLAVFLAALVMRQYERDHRYHEQLHDFSEGFERLLMTLVLILFGGLVGSGLLGALSWKAAIAGLVIVLLLRPLTAFVSLLGTKASLHARAAISFFGIRGIGSLYYLAYALNQQAFEEAGLLWSTVSFTILLSMLVHGATATTVMRYLDRRRLS